MNRLRIYSHLTATMLNLWDVLASILLPTLIWQSLVKSISMVVKVYNFVAETVDES